MLTRPLRSVAKILIGYQNRERIEHDPNGTHRLVLGRDFQSRDRLRTKALLAFNPDRDPEPYLVKPGDVLFQARGSEHLAYCIADPPPNTLAASSFYILRPLRRDLLPQYLAWWINQRPSQHYLQTASQTASMPFVSKAILSRLEIRIPDLRTQEAIRAAYDLMGKELALQEQIAMRRKSLIEAICMNSIRNQGAR